MDDGQMVADDHYERGALRLIEPFFAADAVHTFLLACGRNDWRPGLWGVIDRLSGVSRARVLGHELQQWALAPLNEPLEAGLHAVVVLVVHGAIHSPLAIRVVGRRMLLGVQL